MVKNVTFAAESEQSNPQANPIKSLKDLEILVAKLLEENE
jgi:hypothetical protein